MKLPSASATAEPLSSAEQLRALVDARFDVGLDAFAMDRRDDRPHLGLRIESVADPNLLRALDDALDEAVVQRPFENQPRARRTDLTGVCKDAEERVVDRRVEVGVRKDDVRRFAAQLERDLLEIRRRIVHDAAPGLGAAREGDLVDERARGDRVTDGGARTRHDVDDSRRELQLFEDHRQPDRREGRQFRRFQNANVAGRKRRRQLPGRHQQRIVPRNDLSADADRLADRERLRRRRNVERLPVRLGREAGVVTKTVGRVDRIVLGFAQRLAVVERVDPHELVACASMASATLKSSAARSAALSELHGPSSKARRAARIAASASAAVASATVAMMRPLAGLASSRVPPSAASLQAAVDVHRNHAVDARQIAKNFFGRSVRGAIATCIDLYLQSWLSVNV